MHVIPAFHSPLVAPAASRQALKRPIRWLPVRDPVSKATVGAVPVRIERLKRRHVSLWHRDVQPFIDRHFKRYEGRRESHVSATEEIRADVGWNWWHILTLLTLHNAATVLPLNRSGLGYGWALLLGEHGHDIPLGLMTMVPEFHCKVDGVDRSISFVWYFADAPAAYLQERSLPTVRNIAKALLDTAIQTRIDIVGDASTLLRAAPAGGPRLKTFYEKHCEMTPLKPTSQRVSWFRSSPSDEYFELSDIKSRNFSQSFDDNRQPTSPLFTGEKA